MTAGEHASTSALNVTGTVAADISRTIPVVSLANGRVVGVHARLGDYVRKGQLLLEVQSTDISGAFDQYLKASNDERLANTQLERAKLLYDRGALSKSQLDIVENSELDAKTDLVAAEQQLRVLGVDKTNPSAAVKIYSPATGVIISQNVTDASAAGVSLSGSSTAFTIADLSHVWVICDVYENDLATLRLGQSAEIHLNAYPGRTLKGTVSDIGAVLDPSIRTAKVRIQVENPSMLMRIGMFASVVLYGQRPEMHASLPATAILHLQDRDWVFAPAGDNQFRRIQVRTGMTLPNGQQEILAGLQPGQQVVAQALSVQNSVAQR
ncbi:efflux RND transporter periplasmic adaptor subunit [Edaphobacter bradus]|uniref:efflux RND transporter periplasmic adaptor subunit n=1 Tax=Edaphobacter bradus TaxID=2259016 RepID=UPI0021E0CE34|nr:efflux RND transporter periplasmic adaptor subunit [Edaphobacter bradus]